MSYGLERILLEERDQAEGVHLLALICQVCGSLVVDERTHDRWHESQARR
jgi:hypothetical protein